MNSDGVSTVTVTINDLNGVGLTGFVNLMIDADAGSTVLFKDSNLKTHRIDIKGGTGEDRDQGLAQDGGRPGQGDRHLRETSRFQDTLHA